MPEGVIVGLTDVVIDEIAVNDSDGVSDRVIDNEAEELAITDRVTDSDLEGLAVIDDVAVIEGVAVTDPETLSESELVERSVRVIDRDAGCDPEIDTDVVEEGVRDPLGEELEDCVGEIEKEEDAVAVIERDGLGVEEIGGDGDRIPTLPEKW